MKSLRIYVIIFIWLFRCFCAECQTVDEFAKTVVFLQHAFTQVNTNQNPPVTNSFAISGTGFLLAYNNSLYLVTAKHVAAEMGFTTNDTVSFITPPTGKRATVELAAVRDGTQTVWIHHPKVDVSVIPFKLGQPFYSVDVTPALSKWTYAPPRQQQLVVIGFPLGLGARVADDFGPLTRRTRAASRFLDEQTIFLLEDPSVQGYSGSPVVYSNEPTEINGVILGGGGGGTYYGVISSTLSDSSGGKLAGVVPIKWVAELILEDQQKRGKHAP